MNVLFVCRGNVGRSQMAEGFFRHYYPEHEVKSCGTSALKYVSNKIGDFWYISPCMKEKGIDISEQRPKQISPELTNNADIIVTMSQEELPSYVEMSKVTAWQVPDPASRDFNFHRGVRDSIDSLVKGLSSRLR